MKKKATPGSSAELRQQAEVILRGSAVELTDFSAGNIQRLIHELQVYQIELDLQNEELRKSQLEVEMARDRYADLYDFAPVGYFTINAKGVIIETNLTGAAMLGVERNRLLKQPLSRFIIPEDQDIYYFHFKKLSETLEPQSCALRLVEGDAQFYAQIQSVSIVDQAGNFSQCRLTVSDNSQLKRAEEALHQADKLESLGVMASGIAHDFNNLLTSMRLENALAREKLPASHPVMLHLDRAETSISKASKLADQILSYSGKGHFQFTSVNLNSLIEDNTALLETLLTAAIVLHVDLAPDILPIEGDSSQLLQLITNLVVNAAEAYNGKPGTVWLTTKNEVVDGDHSRGLVTDQPLAPGNYVCLDVKDRGNGIEGDDLSRIFEPFFTTKSTGRGLGLAVVFGVIRGHRGDIFVSSQIGQGSHFKVLLPAKLPTIIPISPGTRLHDTEVASPSVVTRSLVLIIDDDKGVNQSLGEVLEDLIGCSVLIAENGLEGVRAFAENMDDIGVVLLDLTMPVMNGREALQELRKLSHDVPIYLMSGYD
jgi:two-component system, cell cycle sensor histidine kinase and response regulator CckA